MIPLSMPDPLTFSIQGSGGLPGKNQKHHPMEITLNSPHAADLLKAKTALLHVIDPELNVNIIDLGLVYEVDFSTPESVTVIMTLTTSHCPMGEAITTWTQQAMAKAFPDFEVTVRLIWDPPWNFEMISEEGRRQLDLN